MIRTVALADIPPEPWANGGGLTQPLLAWPQAEDWRLRISVARIERDGPFSAWPGVMRDFAVLSGTGVRLRWGERAVLLTPHDEVLSFDGGGPPHGELLDGPTLGLNLMVRSHAGQGGMRRAVAGEPWLHGARWRALFTLHAATLHVPGEPLRALPAGTLAYSAEAWPKPWAATPVTGPLHAFWLHFEGRREPPAWPAARPPAQTDLA